MPPDPARLAAIEGELGSLLLVGFRGTEAEGNADLEDLLCETRVGGILLFARNIVDAEQLARLTEAATTRSAACTARRLFVAVDAEGGNVMRLAPGAGWSPTISAQELGERNDFTLTELEARRIGAMLRAAGINWDLAPVVDVGYNPANSVIVGTARSFGANPLLVAEHARAFIRGLRAEGVDVLLIADDRLPDGRSAAAVALEAVRGALAKGTLDISRVEAALERVRALRGRLN